jgi:hypothetical protein
MERRFTIEYEEDLLSSLGSTLNPRSLRSGSSLRAGEAAPEPGPEEEGGTAGVEECRRGLFTPSCIECH